MTTRYAPPRPWSIAPLLHMERARLDVGGSVSAELEAAARPHLAAAARVAPAGGLRQGHLAPPAGWFETALAITSGATGAGAGIGVRVDRAAAVPWLVEQVPLLAYATMHEGLIDDVQFPVGTGAITVGAVAEGAAATNQTPTIGRVSLTPRQLEARVTVTRRALTMSDGWIDEFVARGLANQIGEKLLQVLLAGSGTNEPTGLGTLTGLAELASPEALGSLSLSTFSELRNTVKAAKVPEGPGLHYLLADNVAAQAEQSALRAGGSLSLCNAATGQVEGLGPYMRSTLLTDNVALYGDLAEVHVGLFHGPQASAVELLIDPFTAKPSVVVDAFLFYDVDVARPGLWARSTLTASG